MDRSNSIDKHNKNISDRIKNKENRSFVAFSICSVIILLAMIVANF